MFARSPHLLLLALLVLPAGAQDRDGDGLSDRQEETLGTDPATADLLQTVLEDVDGEGLTGKEGYDPSKDVLRVEFTNVGGNRYLWKATFAAPPTPENQVFHLYVDADANAETGRKGGAAASSTGTDYMLSVVGAKGQSTAYAADGSSLAGPPVTFQVVGDAIYLSADVELRREGGQLHYALYALSHTLTAGGEPVPMTDGTRKQEVTGVPVSEREKIMRPGDYTSHRNVTSTFGLDLLRTLLADPATVEVRYDELTLDGFEVDLLTQMRYGHLKQTGAGAKASTKVSRAGRYHVGFMMYDDGEAERVVIRHNDEFVGLAVSDQDNNRTWLYYLTEPRDLKVGDEVSVEAAGSGKHPICNILFFPAAPETRRVEFKVENVKALPPVGTAGKATISWTTTWPSDTRLEYGPTSAYGQVATEASHRLVHKIRLEGLDPSLTYHARAVATDREGQPYASNDFTFSARQPAAPPTQAEVTRVPLTIRNPHPVAAVGWPVSGGVPFPQATLSEVAKVRLMRDGQEVPAQIKPTGSWPDGSLKWVLVTLLADLPAGGEATYTLEYGQDIRRAEAGAPMATLRENAATVDTGAIAFTVDSAGRITNVRGGGRTLAEPLATEMTIGPKTYRASAEGQVALEENGPLRAVIRSTADLVDEQGEVGFRIEQRVEAYRGRPYVRVYHTFVNTLAADYTEVESLTWRVPLSGEWTLPQRDGEPVALADGQRLWQRFAKEYVGPDGEPAAGRLTGSAVSANGAVAVRDGWQQYPKGFAADPGGLTVELAPDFEAGWYDEFPFEKEGHQLYYYLLNGHYKFKRGMAKTHELLVSLAPPLESEAACTLFQQPPLLTAAPTWYCDSKAFYNIAPRDEVKFKAYEEAVDQNLIAYQQVRERQQDYGLMNWGDWYGERGANWGNIEYDTQHAFFLEYIRSGNPEAFRLGEQAELHNRDIDTIQWGPDPREVGAVYVHQMGHVGGYYDQSVPGTLGIPRAGYTVSHAWTEGHFDHYFLTGDPRSLETGMAIADFFIEKELSRPYDWVSARVPGWHLILNAAALAATNDPYYLNASRIIVDRVLETQDTLPRPLPKYQQEPGRTHQFGGWSRMMVPGHCTCEPRHQGNANFMIAILLTGLTYYHDVTAEPAVKDAIILGSRYLLDETYNDEIHKFRYTSCPQMRYTSSTTPLYVEAIARAYRWTHDERFKDVMTNGLALGVGGSGYGKGFSMYYRCAPRLLYDLDQVGLSLEEKPEVVTVPFKKPDWLTELKPNQHVVMQAEEFSGQGGGECQIRDDRLGVWNKMITYWHQDLGHWLEWSFRAPMTDRYRVLFRYASSSENPVRKFELDGRVPAPAAESVAFAPTGGFGALPSDWQWRTLTDGAGQPLLVDLTEGEHTVRMTNLGDGLGLDFILLVRADAAVE